MSESTWWATWFIKKITTETKVPITQHHSLNSPKLKTVHQSAPIGVNRIICAAIWLWLSATSQSCRLFIHHHAACLLLSVLLLFLCGHSSLHVILFPHKINTTTQLLFGRFATQVPSSLPPKNLFKQEPSHTPDDCLCLLTLLPSLPGSPGWAGMPSSPWIRNIYYSVLYIAFWGKKRQCRKIFDTPVDN